LESVNFSLAGSYGDACIFAHERESFVARFRAKARAKAGRAAIAAARRALVPPACGLCGGPYREPLAGPCGHPFCGPCALAWVAGGGEGGGGSARCPQCGEDTEGSLVAVDDVAARVAATRAELERQVRPAAGETGVDPEEAGRGLLRYEIEGLLRHNEKWGEKRACEPISC
jgi:hypothetical protein